jgi:hypothetical protein
VILVRALIRYIGFEVLVNGDSEWLAIRNTMIGRVDWAVSAPLIFKKIFSIAEVNLHRARLGA